MRLGRWLTNVSEGEALATQLQEHVGAYLGDTYLADKLVGPPKATETRTVEQLMAAGMIGLYERPEEANVDRPE